MRKKAKLTSQEQHFCVSYVNTGNVRESAKKAGYIGCFEQTGLELLKQKDINLEIKKLYKQKRRDLSYKAFCGYERLAFGNITDALKLMFWSDEKKFDLESLDLFNISEIKKPREGAIEIKFFDRLKALEKLQDLNILSDESQGNEFYKALEKSCRMYDSQVESPGGE
jgi:phage terminase small subunit